MSELNKPIKPIGGGTLKKVRGEAEHGVLQFGKVQPQAIPLEEAVLGAIMIDKNALPTVLDILQPASFYVDGHKHI